MYNTNTTNTTTNTTAANSTPFRGTNKLKTVPTLTPTPIPSYGIILISRDTNRILISQRRDTIEYMEFLRGRVPKSLYPMYFSRMTGTERNKLLTYTFSQLWNDLWVNHSNRFYREIYPLAKAQFDAIRPSIPSLLEMYPSEILEPEWGFPKGKRNSAHESPERAAFREFEEETRIKLDYRCLLDIPATTETFIGTNGKLYSTTYLFAMISSEFPIINNMVNSMRINTVSEEIGRLKWVTLDEARNYLNSRKIEILESRLLRASRANLD